jgi:transcriptional regulator with XRE-family HTH domain
VRTLAVNKTGLTDLRRRYQITSDRDLSHRIGVDPGTVSRVLSGKAAPGPVFVASVLLAFPVKFEGVFDVIDTAETEALAS